MAPGRNLRVPKIDWLVTVAWGLITRGDVSLTKTSVLNGLKLMINDMFSVQKDIAAVFCCSVVDAALLSGLPG